MSALRQRTRKVARAKTGDRLRREVARDTRWADRHGIPECEAWRWDRHPDASMSYTR